MGLGKFFSPLTSQFSGILGDVGADLGFGQPQTTTQTQKLPAYLQPYMTDIAKKALGLPALTQTPFSPETEQAFEMYRGVAGAPSTLLPAAQAELEKTMAGGYMPGVNPYLEQALGYALEPTEESIKSLFSKAGRYGSPAMGGVLARELGGIRAKTYADQYGQERGKMMQAMGLAPQFQTAADQRNIMQAGLLGNIGQMKEAQAREAQELPYQTLSRYANLIYPQAGFSGVTEQYTPGGSPISGLLGALSTGAGVYKAFA